MAPIQNTITVVLGVKGFGKTTLLERLIAGVKNVLVVDLMGAYAHISKGELQRRLPNFTKVKTAQELEDLVLPWPGPPARQPNREWRALLIMEGGSLNQQLLDAAVVMEKWYRKTKAESTIVIDEVDVLNRGIFTSPVIEELVKRGRHIRVNQLYATRRPQEISKLITANMDHLYVLHTTQKHDLEYLKNANFPAHVVAELPHLKLGQYFHMNIPEALRITRGHT